MRTVPPELARRYVAEGWWTRDTLGDLLARGLGNAPAAEFRVHSAVRPWTGTFQDVERTARCLAAGALLSPRASRSPSVSLVHQPSAW